MSEDVAILDIREHIHSGREPFSLIMGAVSKLAPGQKLQLIVPFEPQPLYGVMAQRGFDHETRVREDGDYEVMFSPQ